MHCSLKHLRWPPKSLLVEPPHRNCSLNSRYKDEQRSLSFSPQYFSINGTTTTNIFFIRKKRNASRGKGQGFPRWFWKRFFVSSSCPQDKKQHQPILPLMALALDETKTILFRRFSPRQKTKRFLRHIFRENVGRQKKHTHKLLIGVFRPSHGRRHTS